MGIALRRGRLLDEHDAAAAPPVVLISESLARRQFHDQNAIGQRVHVGPMNRPWYTIVGVVGDVKQTSLAESRPDAVYITPAQSWFTDQEMSLVVRARGSRGADAQRARCRDRTDWSGGREPRPNHTVVRCLAARSGDISRRDRAAARGVGDCMLGARGACGTRGSVDHVEGGVAKKER